jgi:hypothetical protein
LVSLLTEEILSDPIIEQLEREMVIALREHFHYEKQYIELLDNNEYEFGEKQELFQELELCLADSTRILARLLSVS